MGYPCPSGVKVLQGAVTWLQVNSNDNGPQREGGQGLQMNRRVTGQAVTGCHQALPSCGLTHALSCAGLRGPPGMPKVCLSFPVLWSLCLPNTSFCFCLCC